MREGWMRKLGFCIAFGISEAFFGIDFSFLPALCHPSVRGICMNEITFRRSFDES